MAFLNHPSTKGLRELRPVRSNHCIRSYVSLEVIIGLSVYLVKPFWLFHAIDFQRKGPSRNADAFAPWPVRRPTQEIETKHVQLARFRSSLQRFQSSLLPPGALALPLSERMMRSGRECTVFTFSAVQNRSRSRVWDEGC